MIGNLGYDIKNLVAGGLQMGPCYYYMWYELWARNGRYFQLGEDLTTPYYPFCEMPVSSGEVCYGGAMGLGLARTLLWGRPNPACHNPDCGSRECGSDGCGGSCGTCGADETCVDGYCETVGPDGGDGSDAADANDGGDASDAGGNGGDAADGDNASDAGGDGGSDAGTDASEAGGDTSSADPGPDGGTADGSGDQTGEQSAGDDDSVAEDGCACGSDAAPTGGLPMLLLLALLIPRRRF